MNKQQLTDKLRNESTKRNVDFNTLRRLYMYDRFIERLSLSKYNDNFVLKGGFYLSTLYGVESRSTMDIDTAFRNANFDKDTITEMINSIIFIDINDDAIVKLVKIDDIRDEDEYGGFRVSLEVNIDGSKESFHIDIATGDPITPKSIKFKYRPTLSENFINVNAYNIETVLAEKIETVLSRAEANSRMRDFYDIYLIYTRDWDNINKDHFIKAIENTFKDREFKGDIQETFEIIKESSILENKWNQYSRRNEYCKSLKYKELIKIIDIIIEEIQVVIIH